MKLDEIPAPPERHPRARKHTTATMTTAIAMYADGEGWTPREIAGYFANHGTLVSVERIKEWVVPGLEEYRRDYRRDWRAKRRATVGGIVRVTHHWPGELPDPKGWLPDPPAVVPTIKRQGGRPTRREAWGAEKADRLLARGLELREQGMPYPSISTAFRVYEGAEIGPDVLRSWLTQNGAVRDPAKSRAMYERLAKQGDKP